MVETFKPSNRGNSVAAVATISNDQEQIDDLRKELQEIRQTMKHLQTQSTNYDAPKAQKQVDIRALRHEQQGMKAYKTKIDHMSSRLPELETQVSMQTELEKKIKFDVDRMHNKVNKHVTHTGIMKREQIQANADLSQFRTTVENIINDHAKWLSEIKSQLNPLKVQLKILPKNMMHICLASMQ